MPFNKKSVFYNAGVMTLAGLALQLLGFCYRIYLSRAAGAEALGLYRLIMPVHSLSLALTIAGARMAETALSAAYTLPQDRLRVRLLTRVCLTCYLSAFVPLSLAALAFTPQIARGFLGDVRITPAVPVMLACVFLTGFELILESVFLGLKRTRVTAISNVLEHLTQAMVVVLILELVKPTDPGVIAGYIVFGMLISEIPVVVWLGFSYARLLREGPRRPKPPPEERRAVWRKVLKYALPVTAGGALTTGIASLGTVLLPRRLAAAGLTESEALSQLGVITGMAMPLMSLPMVFLSALSTVLLPAISGSRSRGAQRELERKIRKAVQAVGLIALPATAILLPLAPELARLLYGQELSGRYLLLLGVSVVLTDYQLVTMAILNGLGEQTRAIRNVVLGETLELACVYVLAALPQLRIYGYILGMIGCSSLVVFCNLRLIRRTAQVRLHFERCFLQPALVALVAGLMTNAVYLSFRQNLGAQWALLPAFGIAVFVCILLYLLIGIRPVRYFRSVLEKKGSAPHAGAAVKKG